MSHNPTDRTHFGWKTATLKTLRGWEGCEMCGNERSCYEQIEGDMQLTDHFSHSPRTEKKRQVVAFH